MAFSFNDLWNSEAVEPTLNGSFDQQGANNSYSFLIPSSQPAKTAASWDNLQLPSLDGILPSSFSGSSTGSASGGSTGAVVDPAHPISASLPSNAAAGAQPGATDGIASGSLADYFFRGVIIILGFIFVAVGLNMFKPGLVPVPVKGMK